MLEDGEIAASTGMMFRLALGLAAVRSPSVQEDKTMTRPIRNLWSPLSNDRDRRPPSALTISFAHHLVGEAVSSMGALATAAPSSSRTPSTLRRAAEGSPQSLDVRVGGSRRRR